MNVLIVAKTRRGAGACIGGISFDGQSVRLVAANADHDETAGLEYSVGEVWAVTGKRARDLIPPHVENFVVQQKVRLPLIVDPSSFIEHFMPPVCGGVDKLYNGLTQAATSSVLSIARGTLPDHSTTFWRPDQPLAIDLDGKRIRYRYPTPDGGRTLTFVGFQEPLATIPAGTLLRVSLSHWWRPEDKPDWAERCYVQLSGWFGDAAMPIQVANPGTTPTALPVTRPPSTERTNPSVVTSALIQAEESLKRVFGYATFRPQQAEIITNLLERRDTLVVMATGSGKSLCYQLPALCFEGLTVVVAPLISLMQDQVDQLQGAGVAALVLNSTVNYGEYLAGMQQVRTGQIKLLYLAPETLLRPEMLFLLSQCGVDCLVIDEAHCISAWGHDFRKEYRQLLPVRERLPEAVWIALTATATPRVRADIQQTLGMQHEDTFVATFDRPNLFIDVQPKQHALQQVLAFIAAHPDQAGILYCATQNHVERLHSALCAAGVNALPYHGGMAGDLRQRNQQVFMRDDVRVMVATVAFGMGINKPDIRFVVHVDLPQDIESYYQQIGRAGRDGLRADCLLLLGYGDVQTAHHLIRQGAPEEAEGRTARLQLILDWADAFACRRRGLLAYFGEEYTIDNCAMCDNCLRSTTPLTDITLAAQKFLSCVVRVEQRFGVGHVIKVLRGSRAKAVIDWQHDRLSTYGIGQEYDEESWKQLARQFIRQGLLRQVTGTGSLKLTEKGWSVFKGEQVWGTLTAAGVRPVVVQEAYDSTLFSHLRGLRKALADAANVPPYVIFADRTLQEMATYFPQSPAAFGRIQGVGALKQERYGSQFLAAIQAYCQAAQIDERAKPQPQLLPEATPPIKSIRSLEVGTRFANGEALATLQASYGVQRDTIIQHLAHFVQAGYRLPAERLLAESRLSAAEQAEVMRYFRRLGTSALRPVFDALAGNVRYVELHLLRAAYLADDAAQRESLACAR